MTPLCPEDEASSLLLFITSGIIRIAFRTTTCRIQEMFQSAKVALKFMLSLRLDTKHCSAQCSLPVSSRQSRYRAFMSCLNVWQMSFWAKDTVSTGAHQLTSSSPLFKIMYVRASPMLPGSPTSSFSFGQAFRANSLVPLCCAITIRHCCQTSVGGPALSVRPLFRSNVVAEITGCVLSDELISVYQVRQEKLPVVLIPRAISQP